MSNQNLMQTLLEGVAVEWKALGKVGGILRGTAITEKETIVIARSGAYAGLVSYWDIPIFLTDAFSIHPDSKALSIKFLYYVLKNDQTKIHNMGNGAGVPHVRAKDFETYQIPVPPLAEQARIVAILDSVQFLTLKAFKT